jgi:hypothetical protein
MSVKSGPRADLAGRLAAPATALVMLALQIAGNATRDALFLSAFPVTALPWFVGAAAAASFPAALGAGAVLARLGPRVTVPPAFAASGALFAAEAALLPAQPAAAAVVLYFHVTVLGAIVISAFWSLLNERFDSYSARDLFSRVAGAQALGAVLSGLAAERIAALLSARALLVVLAGGTALCVGGALLVGHGSPRASGRREQGPDASGENVRARSHLRVLAVVMGLAAVTGTLCDYVFKADVSARVAGGASLVRFFGLFYAATGTVAFLIQAAATSAAISRVGRAATLSAHPVAVGAAGLLAFVAPPPWRGVLLRSADVTVRHSVFRTGYELLYTSLPEATRRSAKATIDVGWDCLGNGAGAVVVFLLTRLLPAGDLVALTGAVLVVATLEFVAAWRLRPGYEGTVKDDLRRHGTNLSHLTQYAFNVVTMAFGPPRHETVPLPRAADTQGAHEDPLVTARADLRSADTERVRAGLRRAEREPQLVGAVIRLLARKDVFSEVARALSAHLPRAADQLADALAAPATPEAVRRRLPLILRSCASKASLDGLVKGLSDPSFKVRERCGRALLQVTDTDPTLVVPREVACAAAERELDSGSGDERSMRHVFDMLALAFDRKEMAIARGAYESGDTRLLAAALTYLETTLPRATFVKLERRLTSRR